MNSIMNYGFVSPYINFNFAAGSIEPLNFPPTYFMSLVNKRDTEKACSFTLTLMYVPSALQGQTNTNVIDQMLLASVNKPVTYGYGYITPSGKEKQSTGRVTGGVNEQNQYYTGIFTNYDRSIQNGYLTYTITGVSHAVEITSPYVNYQDFIQKLRHGNQVWGAGRWYGEPAHEFIKPSVVVEEMITRSAIAGVREYFEDYEIDIHHTDDEVSINALASIENGPLHDVIFGKANVDNTKNPSGLVYYSYEVQSKDGLLLSSFLTGEEQAWYHGYQELIAHGLSSQVTSQMNEVNNYINNLLTTPYICYFDNVVTSLDGNRKGSFHYIPKGNRQVTNIFNYDFGNSFIDSDVISFSAEYNGAKALAAAPSARAVSVDVDPDGEIIGTNTNMLQPEGFRKQSYNTLSGFNEAAFMSEALLSDTLNYPFTATMEVIGQIDCNQLMDVIQVNVYINGLEVVSLTGKYTIIGIEDNLTSSGFTTKFTLTKLATVESNNYSDVMVPMVGNSMDESSRAYHNQQQLNNS